jgi:ankyrin repeat protein
MGNRFKRLFQRKIIRRLGIVFMIFAVAGGIFLYFHQRKQRWYHYKYPLHDAASRGDVKKVRRLIQRGAAINEGDDSLRTPLDLALSYKNKEIVSFLLSRGARVNVRDRTGETPLHAAIGTGKKDLVEMLIRHGADLDIPWDNGVTPLCGAIYWGYADIAESLIISGADVNARSPKGDTALLWAVEKKNKDLAHLLLDRGAEVNIFNLNKVTPLSHSIDSETSEIAKLLVDHGAEVKPHERDKPTLLYKAVDKGNYEIAKSLIDAGADVNDFSIVEGKKEYIPLHQAAARGHREIVQLLLDHGADKESLTSGHCSPLFIAAYHGQKMIFKMLVDAGARIDVINSNGTPALCLAAGNGRPGAIEMFLDHGADVDIRTSDSREITPLYSAVQYGQEKAAKILLSHHADVNARDKTYGFVPLHLAAMKGDEGMSQLLLSHGADETIRDVFGFTPGEWPSRMKEIRGKRLEEAREKEHHFDPRAILIMVCMGGVDNHLCRNCNAFCIGDGTLLITTAHSASHFVSPKMERKGNPIIVFSPYYGDAFESEVLAIDQEHDLAVLRAPWKSHPALALAKREDLEKIDELLIAGHSGREKGEEISDIVQGFLRNQIDIIKGILNKTPKNDKERTLPDIEFSRNARVERFSIVRNFPDEKERQIFLRGYNQRVE